MKTHSTRLWLCCGALVALLLVAALPLSVGRAADIAIYADALAPGWENWSWNAEVNFNATQPVHSGAAAIAVTFQEAWAGLYLNSNPPLSTASNDRISFWIHGGTTGGQTILFSINYAEDNVTITPQAGTWTYVELLLSNLGSPQAIEDLVWQEHSGDNSPNLSTFYLDNIILGGDAPPPTHTPAPTSIPGNGLSVDVSADRRPISPHIYGLNFPDEDLAAELQLPIARWGGNHTTRYNWEINVSNRGADWFYENIPQDANESADSFIAQNKRTGTASLITIPLIGWTPHRRATGHPYDCGFKVSIYGPQQEVDPWDEDCGNGVRLNGTEITGNNPLDTSKVITETFVEAWAAHLVATHGAANADDMRFYNLDNEPMLWPYTHRDVHPELTTYAEMRDRTRAYAAALKRADPGAQTLGPVVWGWCAYFYSAADGCRPGPDRAAHGNQDFVPWYLAQMQTYETAHGVRLLDYLDVHVYPQRDGIYSESLGNAATQAARLRSTRQLWDPTYTDESWIATEVHLIPRMRAWVDAYYPGTKLAITEYNWGALGYLNGALAQADILGIFGREGLNLATLWGPPSASQPGAYAFRMYRNYDGAGSAFGDTAVYASSFDQEQLAIYAAQRSSDSDVTILVINKSLAPLSTGVSLAGFTPAATAQVFRYSASNLNAIERQADLAINNNALNTSFPAQSITLLVIAPRPTLNRHIYLPLVLRRQ